MGAYAVSRLIQNYCVHGAYIRCMYSHAFKSVDSCKVMHTNDHLSLFKGSAAWTERNTEKEREVVRCVVSLAVV